MVDARSLVDFFFFFCTPYLILSYWEVELKTSFQDVMLLSSVQILSLQLIYRGHIREFTLKTFPVVLVQSELKLHAPFPLKEKNQGDLVSFYMSRNVSLSTET